MLSKALSHFPQFRFRDGQKRLWNPILKKVFANLPEERVRLGLVDYLTLEAGFSSSRISFESPVKLVGDKSSSRTDIICYNADFKPLLLVECKAPAIKLDEKAAIQIARYNQKVEAPFLLVSNGILDFWFEVNDGQISLQGGIPDQFQPQKEIERSFGYWTNRGFIGEKLLPEMRKYTVQSCVELYESPHQPIKYLSFDNSLQDFALNHFYRIFGLEENTKIALSFSATPFGGTRLNVILNRDGGNVAFCTISLDLVVENELPDAEVHSAKGVFKIDIKNEAGFNLEQDISAMISQFHNLFVQYS